uniref:Diacylglycerol kinase catalytic region n=1 Tax=Geobacter sp. (strain M21) TaxID=443144 RepID=C6E4C2_GEOSM
MPLSNDTNQRAPSPFFIVMNAGSGDKDADEREGAIRSVLAAGKRPYRLWRVSDIRRLPEAAREAVQLARQQQGTVVAAGGDGTINSVVQEVLPSGCPFGVLPQGTFNYFSRAHGIPVDPEEACSLLLQGVLRPVQVGLVNQRPFLVNASLGLYPKLLEKREVHKKRFGRSRLVAALSGLATLLAPPPRLVLALDDGAGSDVMHICTLVVDNNLLQLRQMGLPEARAVQHGELAAIVVKAQGGAQLISALALAVLGKLGEADAVDSFSFKRLTVKPLHRGRRIKVATDGEVTWMVPPLVFQAAPDSLLLIVPPPGTVGDDEA